MASTTLANYRTRVAAKLRLDSSADQTLIDSWVNEAYEDVLVRTHCKIRPGTQALTAGTSSYSLSTDILAIHEVYNDAGTDNYLMERITLQELSRLRQFNNAASYPARYFASHGDLIEIFPAPGTGETLTIWYVPRPTALSASGDIPTDIPAEFHKLLEHYALAEGGEYAEHKESSLGLHWRGLYEKGLRDLRAATSRRGSSKVARAKVGRTRDIISSDPSRNMP